MGVLSPSLSLSLSRSLALSLVSFLLFFFFSSSSSFFFFLFSLSFLFLFFWPSRCSFLSNKEERQSLLPNDFCLGSVPECGENRRDLSSWEQGEVGLGRWAGGSLAVKERPSHQAGSCTSVFASLPAPPSLPACCCTCEPDAGARYVRAQCQHHIFL